MRVKFETVAWPTEHGAQAHKQPPTAVSAQALNQVRTCLPSKIEDIPRHFDS